MRPLMRFLSPFAFAFAATIPVVILFYLLKRKRVVQLVSSTLLWQKFLAETQASAPFQRLRHNWLLILQILMLLLAILALARPYFSGRKGEGYLEIVILDASASMQSTDETPNRFEKARGEALKLVDALHDTDQMVILQAAASTEVKQSPTRDKTALRRALQAARVSDTPTRLIEALKLADTLVRQNSRAEVHLFSDGAVPTLAEFENKALPVVYHRVGQRGRNVGIVSLDVRPNPENPAERAIFAGVANFSTNREQAQLELRFNDRVLELKPVTIDPTNTAPQVFIAKQELERGVFTVRLIVDDDLAVDNQASIVSVLPQPVQLLLVSPGNGFLRKALRSIPNVQLTEAATLTDRGEKYDVIVLDNVKPLAWPAPNLLAIHTADTNWFESWVPVENPAIVDWKTGHPILRFVTFDNVQIADTLGVKTPPWAVSLVDSPQTPLLIAGERGRQRIVWIGFDLLHSTWPLRISFPIFVENAIDWLNPASSSSQQLTVRAGDPFRLGLAQPVPAVEITSPDGTAKTWPMNAGQSEFLFGETWKQGIYRAKAGTNQVEFCVNLMDSAESNTTPKPELSFGEHVRVAQATMRPANLELWRWIAAGALLILLFEWWYYHRRTA